MRRYGGLRGERYGLRAPLVTHFESAAYVNRDASHSQFRSQFALGLDGTLQDLLGLSAVGADRRRGAVRRPAGCGRRSARARRLHRYRRRAEDRKRDSRIGRMVASGGRVDWKQEVGGREATGVLRAGACITQPCCGRAGAPRRPFSDPQGGRGSGRTCTWGTKTPSGPSIVRSLRCPTIAWSTLGGTMWPMTTRSSAWAMSESTAAYTGAASIGRAACLGGRCSSQEPRSRGCPGCLPGDEFRARSRSAGGVADALPAAYGSGRGRQRPWSPARSPPRFP